MAASKKSREIFRNTDSKGAGVVEPMFYERWYDEQSVSERLSASRRCWSVALGETLAFDPWISGERNIPKVLRAMLWPLEPLVAMFNFGPNRARPLSMFLVFEKRE
jgi:hypothetical protein